VLRVGKHVQKTVDDNNTCDSTITAGTLVDR